MKSRSRGFNGFLIGVVALWAAGCTTTEEQKHKKELSSLRIHVEADGGGADHSSAVSIHRSKPLLLNIDREAVLDERDVSAALVVHQAGDLFSVEINFTPHGSRILERVTVMNKGRHLAIFSEFGQGRWLAAPLITAKNSSGMLTFTPDATREEAERFVRGLNNTAKKIDHLENWPFKGPLEK